MYESTKVQSTFVATYMHGKDYEEYAVRSYVHV